jgi:hypothetical protein
MLIDPNHQNPTPRSHDSSSKNAAYSVDSIFNEINLGKFTVKAILKGHEQ